MPQPAPAGGALALAFGLSVSVSGNAAIRSGAVARISAQRLEPLAALLASEPIDLANGLAARGAGIAGPRFPGHGRTVTDLNVASIGSTCNALMCHISRGPRRTEAIVMKRHKRTAAATNSPTRMIGYARVSTEEQAREGVSMDAQRERLTPYCTAQGYALVALETDNGTSGSITPGKRPGLARALARIRRGEADGLLALKLDRISRSTRDVLDLVDESRRRGWRLVSVAEQLDTGSAAGRLVLTVLAALSQMEWEQVAERTRMALAELARQGRARSRFAPFGFCTETGAVEITRGSRASLIPHPAEHPVLERILDLRNTDVGATAIARALNAAGLTNRSGGNWTRQSVASVLLGFDRRQAATSCSNGTAGNRAGRSL